MAKKIPFVDLFCGAGGLSVGFEQAGFKSVFANDYDTYACQTYAYNHPKCHVHEGNVEDIDGKFILEKTGCDRIPLIIGGPNCQGVSLRGKRDPNDPKNKAFYNFVRLVKDLKPDWFVMENVPGLMHRHNRDLVTSIFEEFDKIGYKCGGEVLLAADYGVPQLRYRFIIIGNRAGAPLLFPNQTFMAAGEDIKPQAGKGPYWRTAWEAIGDLPPILNGGGAEFIPYSKAKKGSSDFLKYVREGSDGIYNHACHKTPDHNIELIKHIPQGGNWKDIPEKLRPKRFKHVALKDHTTTYGRLRKSMPARTVTTYCNNISSGAFTHPTQHRGISVREGARLQSFPDHYRFIGPLSRQYRQVGNAVPPLLAYNIAVPIRETMLGKVSKLDNIHPPAVQYSRSVKDIVISRPLQGMRFNLDKHLVTGEDIGISDPPKRAKSR